MNITNFEYGNYFGTYHFKDVPEKVNVLLTPNGKGKTTYISALKQALMGDNKSDEQIQKGYTASFTRIMVNGNDIFREKKAGVNQKLKVNNKTTTQKSLNQLYESYGVSPGMVKFLTSTDVLANMTSEELSSFFLDSGYLPVSVDIENLITLCSPISPECEEELRNRFPTYPGKITLDDIKAAYTAYVSTRKEFNTLIKDKVAKSSILDTVPPPSVSLADLDKEINTWEAKVSSLEKDRKTYVDAVKKKERFDEQLKDIETKLAANKATRPVPATLIALTKKRDDSLADSYKKRDCITVLKKNIETFSSIVGKLETSHCPIHKDIVCTTDKSSIRVELMTVIDENTEQLSVLNEEYNALVKEVQEADKGIEAYHLNEKLYKEKTNLLKNKEFLKENYPVIPPAPDSSLDVATIARKRAAFAELRKEAVVYEEALKERSMAEDLKDTVKIYEELVNKLSPKAGIREAILGAVLEPLVDECNTFARQLKSDFEIRMELENGCIIKAKTAGSTDFIEFDCLSNGEKAVVELLIMDLINKLTGFNILVLDNLDSLDAETFDSLMKCVTSKPFLERYDHIFIAAVNHKDTEEIISKYSVHRVM